MARTAGYSTTQPMPASAGIGLRQPHHTQVLAERPPVDFLEVHSENYFQAGGSALQFLDGVRQYYPLSLHGVGLSLGSTDPLDDSHLLKLGHLVERYDPWFVSDHLCWSSAGGMHFNDLLPLPYTDEAFMHVAARIDAVQAAIGRRLLVENVSSYLTLSTSSMPEWEFLAGLAKRTGCGILLDINNVYVNACNHGFDALKYLFSIPGELVEEVHLGGFTPVDVDGTQLLVDTHDHPVSDDVWQLYTATLERTGPKPTLIEWDTNLPSLNQLVGESMRARACLGDIRATA